MPRKAYDKPFLMLPPLQVLEIVLDQHCLHTSLIRLAVLFCCGFFMMSLTMIPMHAWRWLASSTSSTFIWVPRSCFCPTIFAAPIISCSGVCSQYWHKSEEVRRSFEAYLWASTEARFCVSLSYRSEAQCLGYASKEPTTRIAPQDGTQQMKCAAKSQGGFWWLLKINWVQIVLGVNGDYSPNEIVINIYFYCSLFIFILHIKYFTYITYFVDIYHHVNCYYYVLIECKDNVKFKASLKPWVHHTHSCSIHHKFCWFISPCGLLHQCLNHMLRRLNSKCALDSEYIHTLIQSSFKPNCCSSFSHSSKIHNAAHPNNSTFLTHLWWCRTWLNPRCLAAFPL